MVNIFFLEFKESDDNEQIQIQRLQELIQYVGKCPIIISSNVLFDQIVLQKLASRYFISQPVWMCWVYCPIKCPFNDVDKSNRSESAIREIIFNFMPEGLNANSAKIREFLGKTQFIIINGMLVSKQCTLSDLQCNPDPDIILISNVILFCNVIQLYKVIQLYNVIQLF